MVCEIHVLQFPDCEMVEISNGMICSKTCCATWIFTAEDKKFWIEKRKQTLASCQFLDLERKRVPIRFNAKTMPCFPHCWIDILTHKCL
jgi:hypothetical protein